MSDRQTVSSGSLNLIVEHGGNRFRAPVAPGVTIGRSPDCTISIEDSDLAWIHSRVYGGDPESENLRLVSQRTRPDGSFEDVPFELEEVELLPGVTIDLTDNVCAWCAREVEQGADEFWCHGPRADEDQHPAVAVESHFNTSLGRPAEPSLRLTVIHDAQGRVVEVRHGLTIGRSLKCTIPIDDHDLCAVHARVQIDPARPSAPRIVSEQPGFAFVLPSGRDSSCIELKPGCEFRIGERVLVRCESVTTKHGSKWANVLRDRVGSAAAPAQAGADAAIAADAPAPPLRVSCPRCRMFILHLAVDARFCPKCGLTLPECCPPWEFANGAAERDRHEPGSLLAWLLMRCGRDSKQSAPEMLASIPRPATLVAYINSMFNLGMRFEDRHAAEHNLGQALRYYEKAAKLGSDQAKLRLGVQTVSSERGDASRT